jgi:hypothetical protein
VENAKLSYEEMDGAYVAFDLDGTLAEFDFDKWADGDTSIGAPIKSMVEMVKMYIESGVNVKIFTARISTGEDSEQAKIVNDIQDWCERAGLPKLDVTNLKTYKMTKLYDDKAEEIMTNKGFGWREIILDIYAPISKDYIDKDELVRKVEELESADVVSAGISQTIRRLISLMSGYIG